MIKIDRLVFSPIEVNTYIVSDDSGECVIIDCGCYNEDENRMLKEFLDERDLRPVALLNTHMHLDHIFGNRFIKEEYGLLTHASPLEERNRSSSVSHAIMFGLSMNEPPVIGKEIGDREKLVFGNMAFDTIFVPGHTAGSIAFYLKDISSVITGDALFAGSIGRTDLPGGDHSTLIRSIKEGLLVLPGETKVYPGHGPATSIENERNNNSYLT